MTNFKLGKLPTRHDSRTLKLAKYLTVLPVSPARLDWTGHIKSLGMMANDQYGDCTCAGVGHSVQTFTAANGAEAQITDAEVLDLYTTITGQEGAAFDPATGNNDNGCVELDVLNYWRKNAFAGHALGAYVQVSPSNLDHVRAAIALFGVVYIGVGLPITAQNQGVWDVTDPSLSGDAAFGSWGGHCVILTGYDSVAKTLTCITWDEEKLMTERWFTAYCDEAYPLLSVDWVSGTTAAPSGFNLAQLQADLAAL